MAVFVDVAIDEGLNESGSLDDLVTLCPVDVFTTVDGKVSVDDDQLDECTFCGLCWEKHPGGVKVSKLY